MSLIPLGDRIVIKSNAIDPDKPINGIFMPQMSAERPQEGVVVAVGPGRLLDTGVRVPLSLEVGDRVIYSKFSGVEIVVEGESVLVMGEKDVLVILERAATSGAGAGSQVALPFEESRLDVARIAH